MGRLKITGYIDTDDLRPEDVDLEHDTGLSSEGFDILIAGVNDSAIKLSDLEDVEVEIDKEN